MATVAGLAELLARRLSVVFGSAVEVTELCRLTGGASRETWSFTATPAAGPSRRLVLRRDPPGLPEPDGMAREAAVLTAASRAGVPVPELVDHGADPATVGAPYLISRHVEGETIARRLLRDPQYAQARSGMAAELGRTLARVHTIPAVEVPGLECPSPLAQLRATYDELGEPLPAVEIALHWLARHRPEPVPAAVVHGDFRNGNLIIGPEGLRAVLDWELVHLGDPRQDLGWLCVKCWRFGAAAEVGGFGPVGELLDGYAEVAGTRPDPAAVHWWQVYGTAWWAVGCRVMAERHLSGATCSVELAAIGRRVCEQEHDLLLALGVPPGPRPQLHPEPVSDLHGRPTAGELLDAVASSLRAEVVPADGCLGFTARVAANVVDLVGRELALGSQLERRHRERLARFGCTDNAQFASAIRDRALDPQDPQVLAAVREAVTDRLLVANPRYLDQPG